MLLLSGIGENINILVAMYHGTFYSINLYCQP